MSKYCEFQSNLTETVVDSSDFDSIENMIHKSVHILCENHNYCFGHMCEFNNIKPCPYLTCINCGWNHTMLESGDMRCCKHDSKFAGRAVNIDTTCKHWKQSVIIQDGESYE